MSGTFPGGQLISQVGNGAYTQSGPGVTVTNGAVAPGAATNFGSIGSVTGVNDPPVTVS